MYLKLFTMRFDPERETFDDAGLQKFCADKEVIAVYEHVFQTGDRVFWGALVKYRAGTQTATAPDTQGSESHHAAPGPARSGATSETVTLPARPQDAVAPKSPPAAKAPPVAKAPTAAKTSGAPVHLEPHEADLYEHLRRWRAARAKERNQPPYVICFNKELECIVKALPADVRSMSDLRGLRTSVVAEHGEAILGELRRLPPRSER